MFGSTHLDPKSKQYQEDELDFRASGKERRYAWDYDAEMDIFAYSEKTGTLKQLTTAQGYDAEGGYSPDGQWIVFSSMRDAYNRTLSPAEQKQLALDALVLRRDLHHEGRRLGQKRLTDWNGYDGGTFFTKDGRIVWRHFDENGLIANVWTMKLDGTDKKQITDFGAMSWAPYEHPSGEYFVFASNKLGFENFEVFMVDKAGTKEPVRITYTDGFDGLPVPSPDGTQMALTSSRGGGWARPGRSISRSGITRRRMAALKAGAAAQAKRQVDEGHEAITKDTKNTFMQNNSLRACDRCAGTARGRAARADRHGRSVADEDARRDARLRQVRRPADRLARREAGRRLHHQRAEAHGREAAAGHDRLPHAVHVHGRLERRRHDAQSSRRTGQPRRSFSGAADVQALSFSDSAETTGAVVFAGYGLVVPEVAELRLRQLRRPRREGQDRRRPALFP